MTLAVSRRRLVSFLGAVSALSLLGGDQNAFGAEYSVTRAFETFLESSASDFTAALEAAVDWSSRTRGVVTFSGTHRLSQTVIVKKPVRFRFLDALFEIEGSPKAAISNGAVGPMGFLFQDVPDLQLSGKAYFSGVSTGSESELAGIVIDSCERVRSEAHFTFKQLAIGMFALWCDDGIFGDIDATMMKGRQPFGSNGTAGSALVLVGCRNSHFGRISSRSNYKPVLYCSVGYDRNNRAIDNEGCTVGPIHATAFPGSGESALIAVRSARNCEFSTATGQGFAFGYYIERYDTDEDFSVDGNLFGPLTGDFQDTGASADAAIIQSAQTAAVPVGSNHVQSVEVSCGGEFGIAILSGALSCDRIEVTGGDRPIVVANASLSAKSITVKGQRREAITTGGAAMLAVQVINIDSGSMSGAASALRYHPAFGNDVSASMRVGTIRYRHNGAGTPLQYIIYDPEHSQNHWSIGTIDGTPTVADGQFRSGVRVNFRNEHALPVEK
ncbi:hypothetical protein [Sphingosinicella humi]|uniref:Uncharacterized protein n=1 Tax=Allosphingosinicella humi TaxID=2068657 RepID=A0A2U2J190_9SPHN|nr:hypothetical protein [Sphingosinicella humi]PWG02093.1 hypothetical protein DF286_03840 [Sphingosinicella humi]